MPTRRHPLPTWIRITGIMLVIAFVWGAAIVILPGTGWSRPGSLTALGLVALLVFIVIALVTHHRDWQKMEHDHLERRHRHSR